MSTRCLIGKENADGSVKFIYCHHDGYLDYVGRKLVDFYDKNNIDQLLALGDLSALGNNPVTLHDFEANTEEACISYADRGEDCPARTVESEEEYLSQDCWQEYWYLLKQDGVWYYTEYQDEGFIPVEAKL